MILLIDVGNTNITAGFFEKGFTNILHLKTSQRVQTISEIKRVISHYGMKVPHGTVMCSVVPRSASFLSRAIKRNFGYEPLQVRHDLKMNIKLCIPNPGELGADRIANAVAAHKIYNTHTIVVDFGTATTFCYITSSGEYRGGLIMPGVGISADTLSEKTARLPRISLKAPENVIGNTTEDNILSGLVLGHAGAVERIIKEMKKEIIFRYKKNNKTPIKVVATGGFGPLITPYVRSIKVLNPHLTLQGLKIIYDLNV
ncbi:MAG: type III pantothenate kinase [Nitrospiraceae bacterium]|nr:MAG: type III pantothenate kinase [bacterium]UCF87720.1 MAG: type III pantothenate kinase [Nitrospiraceae bacterium]